ncbi:response regulator transcription factor [Cohnella thailandensis]|uniref:Response regulator n=1 Tax=Cohnella thailandensis TaxID=557557 RepID=A0A841T260_9BACL|nr:response regulator [Cohnella thailandensis]MBB6637129.1 response regulator [Cohnella thailandensis]MBP1977053.1 YesN/AraC family two-component response regulator [Cohnella thailandensis]
MKTLLIVDDEPRTRQGIKKTLEAWSAGRMRIETAASGVEALEWMKENPAHLIITDVRMPELGGLQMLERMAQAAPKPTVIVISGHAEFEYAHKALQLGVVEYLLKPLDKMKLIQAVEKALELEENRLRIGRMEKLLDPKLMEAGQEEAKYGQHVRDAISYIDGHLGDPIGMKQVAEHLHMNSSYFSVLFKEQTGITFSDYLTRRRLQRAKELLAQTRLPIWEIAEKVGYQTAKYFIKVFKDSESVSPSQYRQQVMDPEETIK